MKKLLYLFSILGLSLGLTSFAQTTISDINVGIINNTMHGNVSTNDNVPTGTAYGLAISNPTNPNGIVPIVDYSGSYTFTPTLPGVYAFLVPICVLGGPVPCPTERLVISVLNPSVNTNMPVANGDISVTPVNTSVVIIVKANDRAANIDGTLNGPSITSAPANGSVSITLDGMVIYTANTGFVGEDVFTYAICETPSGLCSVATVSVLVLPQGAQNTVLACDDYTSTTETTTITGNLIINDTNPDDNTSVICVPQNGGLSGQGYFNLAVDGTYVFTPSPGFIGAVSIPYTICDNNSPIACSVASLYIVVTSQNLVKNEFTFNKLKYFPNPVKNSLSISNDFSINKVEIISVLGQKMFSKSLNDLQTEINLSDFANGVYFVKVFSEEQSKTIRIVKE